MTIGAYQAYATKSMTISSAAMAITTTTWGWGTLDVETAQVAYITPRSAGVMLTWSGTTPTTALGHLVAQDTTLQIVGSPNIGALKLIREASTDAVVSITLEH